MKHILIFFALLLASTSYGQIQDWNIKIRSSQDTDSTYVMMSDTAGQYAGRGRWYSLATLADLIEGYLSLGGADNWGTDVVNHDNTLTGNGTVATPLKVDSTKIATQYDISGFLSSVPNPIVFTGADFEIKHNAFGSLLLSPALNTYTIGDYLQENNGLYINMDDSGLNGLVRIGNTDNDADLLVFGGGTFMQTLAASNLSGTNTGDQDLSGYEVGTATNEGSLTVEAGGATSSEIHSNTSGSTDVTLNAAWGLDISENTGTGNITYIADSSQVATQYDLTQITGTADADWYERGTGAPANSITDSIYTSGIVAISETTPSKMLGHLTIGEEGNSVVGLAINNMLDGESAIGIYPSGTYTDGWEFELSDMADFFIRNKISSVATTPFRIDSGTPSHTLYLAGNGNVTISDYPNSRDDGTPTNVLGTDINGVIQSYPVADVQPTTEAIQDIVGAMFTGNTETNVTVDYQDADGTIDVVVTGGSSAPYVITPAQLTSDQDNYAPTGIGKATYIYIDSDNGMRAITGIADSTAGILEKTIINDGSYMIYLPMSHPDSDAAHRFVGWPGDYYIYPGHSVKILYDLVANNWRILGGDLGYTKPTVFYSMSAGTVVAGDHGELAFTAINSGVLASTVSSTTMPGSIQLRTQATTNGGGEVYFAKTVQTFSAFASAHIFAEAIITIPALSDGTDTYTSELQITTLPNTNNLEINNLLGIRYSHGINSGKWQLFCQDNGGSEGTPVDLGVSVAANTRYKLRIEIDAAKSECRAYINGSYVGRVTATLPNSVVCGARIVHLKSAGTNSRDLSIHSFNAGAIYP